MVQVKLKGDVLDRFEINNIKFAVLGVKRKSGVFDNCFIYDNNFDLKVGDTISLTGLVITKKFSRDSKKFWYVQPTAVEKVLSGWVNELTADVLVADEPKIRTSPLGKRIVEISLNCTDTKCYLYAIAFNDYAEKLYTELKKGDRITIVKGRLQSRWYGPETRQTMINEILINEVVKAE